MAEAIEAELSIRRKNLKGLGIVGSIIAGAFILGVTYQDWRGRMTNLEGSVRELATAIKELSVRVGALEHVREQPK